MLKCIDCIHFKACEDWARNFGCYVETTFPYEAEDNLCDYFEPEVHGEWRLNRDGSGTCSNCNFTQVAVWDEDNWQNYCGHCGAKMDGGNSNG